MLDKTRAYVTIYGGVPEDGALYVQDGIRYFPNGEPIVKEAPKTAKKQSKAKSAESAAVPIEALALIAAAVEAPAVEAPAVEAPAVEASAVEASAVEVSSDADGSIDDILSDVAE